MADRQGIEIDYCPQCRGVWLDRGELDKLIERSGAQPGAPAALPREARPAGHEPREADTYRRRKKKNLLDELFDF